MKTLENYTISKLIDKYRNVIGDRLADFIIETGCSGDNKELLEAIMKEANKPGISRKERRKIIDGLYEVIISTYEGADFNNDEDAKNKFLLSIYSVFGSEMSNEELAETKELLIGDREIGFFILDEELDGKPFEIITKEKPKKLKSIRQDKKRELIMLALEGAIKNGDIYSILSMKYKGLGEAMQENADHLSFEEKTEFMINNIHLVNAEDLISNTATRIMYLLIKDKKEHNLEDGDIRSAIEYLRQIYIELNRDEYSHEMKYALIDDETEEVLTPSALQDIEEFLSRCTDNKYYSVEEVEEIHRRILKGDFTSDSEERRIAKIDKMDLVNASKSYELQEDGEIKEKLLECSKQVYDYLKQEGRITDDDTLKLYINDLLNLDIISTFSLDELNDEICNKNFKEIYEIYLYSDDNNIMQEAEEKMRRFSTIYKRAEDNMQVDPDTLIDMLIKSYGEEYEIRILNHLNRYGILDLEKCVDTIGIDIIIKQYEEGKFSPAIVRDLYEKGKINLNDIVRLIDKVPRDKKYVSIGAIFPGENDDDRVDRDLLANECLTVLDDLGSNKKGGTRRRIVNKDKEEADKYITDPFARLSLFQELDKNYTLEMSEDGYAVVICPTAGKVILEKLFDTEKLPYYGAATYILDLDYYQLNKTRIYTNGKIERDELTSNRLTTGVTPIVHSKRKWGERLKDEFDVENSKQYSDEDIKKIDYIIARIERSRERK